MFETHLLSNHFEHYISCMHINGAYGHNLLSVPLGKLANQHGDECFKLDYLLFVIVLHGILITFFQSGKCNAYLSCPPDLSAGQGYLWQHESFVKVLTRIVSKTSPLIIYLF